VKYWLVPKLSTIAASDEKVMMQTPIDTMRVAASCFALRKATKHIQKRKKGNNQALMPTRLSDHHVNSAPKLPTGFGVAWI